MVLFYFITFIVLRSTTVFSDDQIDHAHFLADDISKLYLDESFSDVVLDVENQRFHAHRLVLDSRSDFFSSLPYGDHEVDGKKYVPIGEASATYFGLMLKYIYSGRMDLSNLESDVVLELEILWNKFCLKGFRSTPVFSDDQIDHAHFLADDISKLYLDENSSDVVLVVENEQFHAHRLVLASRSDVFRPLLYGDHLEARQRYVPINEAGATSFKVLLGYIYSGQMNLSDLEGKTVLELLILSNKFMFWNLQLTLIEYLRSNISIDNICSLFDEVRLYHFEGLEVELLNFIDAHALDVLRSEDSPYLSPEAFQLIINRDTLLANEMDIFRAACRWIEHNRAGLRRDDKTKIFSAIRYQLMADEELSEVKLSELVRSDTNILNFIQTECLANNLNYRGQIEPNVNFMRLRTVIPSQIDGGTMIVLDQLSFINYIEMRLFADSRTYSYYIEVSVDGQDWSRAIDYSNYHCRSKQRLWIKGRFVRYIRIVGTNNTRNNTFNFYKVMYNAEEMDKVVIENGLVTPKFSVTSPPMDPTLIEGINERNTLIPALFIPYDGYDGNYGRYSKFTWHVIRSGYILVQLAQPYIICSIRMLLWGHKRVQYKYTIDASMNNVDWITIADKSNEDSQDWQVLYFEPRPMVYIRITGVNSSDGNLFRCVHFSALYRERLNRHRQSGGN